MDVLAEAVRLRREGQRCALATIIQVNGSIPSFECAKMLIREDGSISGTIGQPDAGGAMSGGNYSVTGGFWSLISVAQTAGAPTLYIGHAGNTVTVYWQEVSGWSLVQSGELATPVASWSASSSPTLTNGTNYLTLVNPTGNRFYRLKQ